MNLRKVYLQMVIFLHFLLNQFLFIYDANCCFEQFHFSLLKDINNNVLRETSIKMAHPLDQTVLLFF